MNKLTENINMNDLIDEENYDFKHRNNGNKLTGSFYIWYVSKLQQLSFTCEIFYIRKKISEYSIELLKEKLKP